MRVRFRRHPPPSLIIPTAVAKAELQAQLSTLSTSQTSSSAEVETLKQRVQDTEREKRDLIGIVSRLKEDSTQREGVLANHFKLHRAI